MNALQLCDFNEIFNASFIIIYCTFWFDVIIALLNFDLGRERVFFFSILLFAYFAVVQFLRNILCTHILLLYFCTIKLLYFKLLYAFETYKANMNELDFLEVAKCFFLWLYDQNNHTYIQWRRYNFYEGGRKLEIKIMIPKQSCGCRVVSTMYETSFIIYTELLLNVKVEMK